MRRFNLLFLLIFVVLLVWISFFQADQVAKLQKGTITLFRPFIDASGKLSEAASTLEKEKPNYSEVQAALDASIRERDRLRLEVLQLDEILYENNELRKALLYKTRSPLNLLSARVINRKTMTWYNTIMIDKGAEDLVRPDLAVIVPNGESAALVGKVSEVVGPHSSIVLLLTDEMCQVSAKVEGTEEQGILNGERGPISSDPTLSINYANRSQPNLNLRYLPKNVQIKPGDRIVSAGIGEVFIGDLVLGVVKESNRGVIDTEAFIVPAVDFDKLKDVFIIMPTDTVFDVQQSSSTATTNRRDSLSVSADR